MDKESHGGLVGLSGNGWIAVLLLAAGALVLRERPLEGSRPAADEPRVTQRVALQEVDARLWQDPFGAVVRSRDAAAAKRGESAPQPVTRRSPVEELEPAERDKGEAAARQMVLAVMLPGGPYAENVEARRRTRYAVLAALNTANFAPVDTEHIGYYLPRVGPDGQENVPEFVAFERFDSVRIVWRQDVRMRILLLWLDTDGFSSQPIAGLLSLMNPGGRMTDATVPWHVLGPFGSDGLGELLAEVKRAPAKAEGDRKRLHIHSHAATVSDAVLLGGADLKGFRSVEDFVQRQGGVRLTRTIGSDSALATALVHELELRGLKARHGAEPPTADGEAADWTWYDALCRRPQQRAEAPHQIALVAEWDTLYGRSLHREFRIGPANRPGFCVSRFSYVRGLDGQLPEQAAKPKVADSSRPLDVKEKGQRPAEASIERAEGQGQFDYLRRLAAQLRERDRELRASHVHGAGLRAIGVVGNDVHDKLLVLQALRPEFPDAIFFTTDMDARLLHPREQDWARNLLVASNFGLRLRDELQGTAPPFRDNYQTSAYLSTLLAVGAERKAQKAAARGDGDPGETKGDAPEPPVASRTVGAWFATPRVFEIGRTQAFDFSPREAPGAGPREPAAAASGACRAWDLGACQRIHSEGSRRYPEVSVRGVALGLSLGILVLWLPVALFGRSVRRRFRRFIAGARRGEGRSRRWAMVLALFVVVHGIVPLLLAPHWRDVAEALTRNGKPIAFLEGISIWPTEGLQLVTALLCVYLVVHGWSALANNLDEISLALRTGKTRRQLVAEQAAIDRRLSLPQRVANMFSLGRRGGPLPWPPLVTDTRMSPQTLAFWRFYIVQNRTASRAMRCAACVLAVVVVGCTLLWVLRQWPTMPQRGALSVQAHWAIASTAAIAMNFLVFGVADATLFCVRFVRTLRAHHANWPERSMKHFEARLGPLPPHLLDHWIDLQFVARRTRTVTRLIYYPFIVLSLLLLSRSPVFDNWRMPPAVTFMAAVSIGIALVCAIALRRAAETSRAAALRDFREELLRVSATPKDKPAAAAPWYAFWRTRPVRVDTGRPASAEQLKQLMTQIENLREGAFAPFTQQPLLKAVLLPFATLGGTALVDLLAMANV